MGYEEKTKRMCVELIHPGYTFDDVQKKCSFPLIKADDIGVTDPPTEDELETLRTDVDPQRLIIGR